MCKWGSSGYPQRNAVSQQLIVSNFSASIKEDILEATAGILEQHKVYGEDEDTKALLTKYMKGLENDLDENEEILEGRVWQIIINITWVITEMIMNRTLGATKIQAMIEGKSSRKKKV